MIRTSAIHRSTETRPLYSTAFALRRPGWTVACAILFLTHVATAETVDRFGVFETGLTARHAGPNPYRDVAAEAVFVAPDGKAASRVPLFWDGGTTWRLRFSPDRTGSWKWRIKSADQGLDGQTGSFECVSSRRRGSIQPMKDLPRHFQYQNGERMWFMGDTAWALFTDNTGEKHDRAAAQEYLRVRAGQGFNVVHAMVLSEAGWGNSGGLPFDDIAVEKLNPGYWQEMDRRVAYANEQGLVVGLALAWGRKRKTDDEPFAWGRFPSLDARKRYARYIAARYAAYDVYFLVSGEWHGEVRTRPGTETEIKKEFIAIGDALAAADPHRRMIGIHPMTSGGSVREFNEAAWMSFGDYQQNYRDLHARVLESRGFNKPVVNSEYGYHLRDQSGDGVPDKDNSTSLESIRHASWDIVMAGGYLVTGFGTTYFGGNRDPGPFDVGAARNDDWERQIGLIKQLFVGLNWWKLEPQPDRLTCSTPRGKEGKQFDRLAPPPVTYWLLAEPGKHYVVYARGLTDELTLELGTNTAGQYRARFYNPRTGAMTTFGGRHGLHDKFTWTPTDSNDWILHLSKITEAGGGTLN